MGRLIKNGWILTIMGVLFVLLGIYVMMQPLISFIILAQIIAAYFLVTGILEVAFALSNTKISGWGWRLAKGVLDIIIGAYLLKNPGLPEAFLLFLTAFWILFYGASLVSFSFDIKGLGISGWGFWLFIGLVSIVAACYLLFNPGGGVLFVSSFLAVSSIILGLFNLFAGQRLRKIGRFYH
ncbi:MAG: DUF308 domain-containing protein [Neisseriaceae bacterium]|nr:DUF308 domain-containing protein [Neisseriaceae bacterium]MBP6860973.1 DUF308 domain-containing protein [Neisseriaceae bacterium]